MPVLIKKPLGLGYYGNLPAFASRKQLCRRKQSVEERPCLTSFFPPNWSITEVYVVIISSAIPHSDGRLLQKIDLSLTVKPFAAEVDKTTGRGIIKASLK